MAWVRFLVSLFHVEMGEGIIDAYRLETAQGAQLDALGALAGVSRAMGEGVMLSDGMYRNVLRARIVRNQFGGGQGSLPDIWTPVFGDSLHIALVDNQDMTMAVELSGGDYTPEILTLLLRGYIVPKPLGVRMTGFRMASLFPEKALSSACALCLGGSVTIPAAE